MASRSQLYTEERFQGQLEIANLLNKFFHCTFRDRLAPQISRMRKSLIPDIFEIPGKIKNNESLPQLFISFFLFLFVKFQRHLQRFPEIKHTFSLYNAWNPQQKQMCRTQKLLRIPRFYPNQKRKSRDFLILISNSKGEIQRSKHALTDTHRMENL